MLPFIDQKWGRVQVLQLLLLLQLESRRRVISKSSDQTLFGIDGPWEFLLEALRPTGCSRCLQGQGLKSL
jgi:hypothetical protein